MSIRYGYPIRWTGTGMIFYPQVASVPDLNRDAYETDIFFHPRVIRRVPNNLVPL
jgi:hypothetical protein